MTDEAPTTPRFKPPSVTLVDDVHGGQLMRYEGLVPLPIGTRIEFNNIGGVPSVSLDPERFPNGRADGIVVGLRVFGAQADSAALVLDVELVEPGAFPSLS